MFSIQSTRKLASFSLAISLSAVSAAAMADVMVGGAPMLPSKDIIDNAVNSKDHTRWLQRSKLPASSKHSKAPGHLPSLRRPMPRLMLCPQAPSIRYSSRKTKRC